MNRPLYQHKHAKMPRNWNRAYKASIWDGKGDCHTFKRAYVKVPDDENRIKVKFHRKRLAESDLPNDCTGWEMFVSMDGDCETTYGQETITQMDKQGCHRIASIPHDVPKILTP